MCVNMLKFFNRIKLREMMKVIAAVAVNLSLVEWKVKRKIESFCHTYLTKLDFEIECRGKNRMKNRNVWPGPKAPFALFRF